MQKDLITGGEGFRFLDDGGIPTRFTYNPINLTKYYQNECGYSQGDFPTTEDASSIILTLPFYMNLEQSDLGKIIDGVRSFFNNGY